MRIDIVTLFPEMFAAYLDESILKRARAAGLIEVNLHALREQGLGRHRITDEPPYGGGGGMVLRPEPIFAAVEAIMTQRPPAAVPSKSPVPVIMLTPQGRPFSQAVAGELAGHQQLVLVCGRYEGVDERVREHLITDEISIGDYVLTGGELAAMVVVDAVARLLPGVLGDADAADNDSHATGLLEGPHYTHPETFRGWAVPEVLRSGHAAQIARWRREASLARTWQRRPDLLLSAPLDEQDRRYLLTLMENEIRGEEP